MPPSAAVQAILQKAIRQSDGKPISVHIVLGDLFELDPASFQAR